MIGSERVQDLFPLDLGFFALGVRSQVAFEFLELAGQFFKRVQCILKKESIEFEPAVVAEVINKHFPDWRRVLNELQRYSISGKIDSGILSTFNDTTIKDLVEYMKDKNFTEVRRWVAENMDNDSAGIFRDFYDNASTYFKSIYIPMLVVTIARYQYQDAFTVDKEINMAACLTEIMLEAQWQ